MYENQSEDVIKSRMLSNIDKDIYKGEGSITYDSISPASIEFARVYSEMDALVNKLSIENLEDVELEQRIKERTGITRKPAKKASGLLNITGNANIKVGDLFQTPSGIKFKSTQTKLISGTDSIPIEAVEYGSIGNVEEHQITQMPIIIPGIISITNNEPTKNGYDSESDKELLDRYYERIQTPSTSNNKFMFRNWAKEVVGVGDARIFPLWNGDYTVKIVIVDSNKNPASIELVNKVQEYIDPNGLGLGEGTASMGTFTTVVSANGIPINISFTAIKDSAVSDSQRQESIENNIENYLKEIAFKDNIVSYNKIGSIILNSSGIVDYSNLTVNGGTSNIVLTDEEVPVLGGVNID